MEDEMGNVQVDRGQLNHLVGVVRRKRHQLTVSTGTRGGLDQVYLGWRQQGGAGTRMALASAAFASRCLPRALGFFERRIRRRGLAGGLRGLLHPPLQGVDLLLEVVHALLQMLQMRLDGRRGELPFRLGKGKSPEKVVGFGVC